VRLVLGLGFQDDDSEGRIERGTGEDQLSLLKEALQVLEVIAHDVLLRRSGVLHEGPARRSDDAEPFAHRPIIHEIEPRNKPCCATLLVVPVATGAKVQALTVDFQSQAALADLLGVSRSRVTRWLKGEGIDPVNAERIDLLELVSANLRRIYEPEAVRAWLVGVNPHLGDRRPIDLVRAGKTEELMRAIRAERADSFA
jgi:hypothetical protein